MADDYARQGTTFRARDVGSGKLAIVVVAGEHVRVYDGIQSLTLTGSSQALTVPGSSTHAMIYCEGAATTDVARYWEDGTAPTASVGKRLYDHEELASAAPSSFHAIIGTGSPVLRVAYYHYA